MKETTMKRTARKTTLIVIGCLLAMTATSAAASSARTAEKPYRMSNGMIMGSSEAYWSVGTAYMRFLPRPGERTVVFSATDQLSPDVTIHVHYVTGHGKVIEAGNFCNETDPLPVKPGKRFEVAVLVGECPGGAVSVPTEGALTATFSE
jgi:hypothetical protein